MQIDSAVNVFLTEWPASGAAQSTVRSYKACLTWLSAFAKQRGAVNVEDLTPSLVRAAVTVKLAERSSVPRPLNYKGGEASAAVMVAAARCLSRWLLAEGLAAADLSVVKAPRVPERIQSRLSTEEFQTLELAILRRLVSGKHRAPHVAVARDLALLTLLGETGLRAQECCRLTIDDIDLQRGEIVIKRGKGKKDRALSIVGSPEDDDPRRVVRLIDDWLLTREGIRRAATHRSLWTSIKGTPLSTDELRKVLARICLDAGLSASRPPHAFRRYVFTEHYRQRPGSLPRLVARMGWSRRSAPHMVDVYTRGFEIDFGREPLPLLSSRQETATEKEVSTTESGSRRATMQALLRALNGDRLLRGALLQALQPGARSMEAMA